MKKFVYLNGHIIVFEHNEVQVPFEYWDNEVKYSMETFDNVKVLKITQICSNCEPPICPEFDILDNKKMWNICAFQ